MRLLKEWRAKRRKERRDKNFERDLRTLVNYVKKLDLERFNGMYDGDHEADEEPIRKEEPND